MFEYGGGSIIYHGFVHLAIALYKGTNSIAYKCRFDRILYYLWVV